MKTNSPFRHLFFSRALPAAFSIMMLLCGLPWTATADQIPNPTVTASATAYSSGYVAANMFAPGQGEYATAGQGACSVPLTTVASNGTWVEMDFGSNVTFDRFILATRNNTSDNVGINVLYVGTNAVHSSNDTIFTFDPGDGAAYSFHNGSAPIHTIGKVTGRYVRWECDGQPAGVGDTKNTGGRHMWFLDTPANSIVLGSPTVVTNTLAPVSSTPPYNATYAATHADDGKCGNDASGEEFAINGATSGTNDTVIVFDFGTTNTISGFDFLNREDDLNTAFNLIFSDDPTFNVNIATNSWTPNPTNGNLWTTGAFSPITARFVMFQGTASFSTSGAATPNPGSREMIFYGPLAQPPYIVGQPVAATNVQGDVFNLSVALLTNSLTSTYQWQFNGTNLANGPSVSGTGAAASGSTTATLTITNATPADSGGYSVIVSNPQGVVTSAVSVVSVFIAPVITAQPDITNVLLYPGGSNVVSMTAYGSLPLSFYWYSNNVSVAVSAEPGFLFTNLHANAEFYGVVSNSHGTATSAVVSVTIASPPTFPYPVTVLNDHPIGFWPLNEVPDNGAGNDGTTAFDYVGGNNGLYTNAVLGLQGYGEGLAAEYGYSKPTDTNSSAEFGMAPYLTDSLVGQIPNIDFGSPTLAPSFSVEAWVNADDTPQAGSAGIINKGFGGGGEQFTIDYSGGWRFFVRGALGGAVTAVDSVTVVDGNWHHLAGVLDAGNSNITLYVDGAAAAKSTYNPTNGLLSSDYPVAFGARTLSTTSGYNLNFAGQIENVAIYDYALTAAQVANHYDAAGIAPSVTLPSSTNVDEGSTLTLAAIVPGTPPLNLQWYDITSGTPGTALAKQTNATLILTNISAAAYNGHTLELTASNIYGQALNQITIGVQAGPPTSVTLTPAAITVYAGVPITLTVTAQGTEPFYYQWSSNGVAIAGATNSSYTNIAQLGGTLTNSCVVTNKVGAAAPVIGTVIGVAVPTDSYATSVLKDAPIAYWRLDEPADATLANDFVGGHDANYYNATNGLPGFRPLTIPSETATGFGMNGIVNDSLALENDNTANGVSFIDFSTQGSNAEFSVEAWVKAPPAQNGEGAGVVANGYGGGGEQFCIDSGTTSPSSFRFFVRVVGGNAYVVSSTFAFDDNWHQVVGVCDQASGSLQLYADGAVVGTGAIATGLGVEPATSSFPVSIGSRAVSASDFSYTDQLTNAVMNDVAIYDYPLSAEQVAAHYAAAPAPASSGVSLAIEYVLSNRTAVISWPASAVSNVLQQAVDVPTLNWTTVTNAVTTVNGQNQVVVSPTNAAQFYRLQSQ